MMWSNFHTHSNYCDGKSTIATIVSEAEKSGLKAIGLSSHAPLPFPKPWAMNAAKFREYRDEIEYFRSSSVISIYAGLEVDYIPGKLGPSHFASQLDYTIGSIHFVESFKDNNAWEIDGPTSLFDEGLTNIFNGNVREAVSRYFELTRMMMLNDPPDIVGHLDKIKIHNTIRPYFDEAEAWYEEQIMQTLATIREVGAIVEINTRGVYQKKSATTYPSPWVIHQMLQMNIPVTLSSDAHQADDLTNGFADAAEMLFDIGYRSLHVLSEGIWKPHSFTQHGITTT
jgi:histidinol-phosphatase (PHP family)